MLLLIGVQFYELSEMSQQWMRTAAGSFYVIPNTKEDPDEAKVWLIDEVLNYEPSLAEFIGEPPGSILTRKDAGSNWEVARK